MIAGVILAAGEGRRFGAPKQLAELRGRPLLQHAIDAMLAVPALERVVVVIGAYAGEIRARVRVHEAEWLVCQDWQEGIAASLRCAVKALDRAEALLVTLGDQPFVTPQAIAAVLDAADGTEVGARATYGDVPGHPVLIKRALFPAIRELGGDAGARDLLEAEGVMRLDIRHLCSGADVDTPEDLDALR